MRKALAWYCVIVGVIGVISINFFIGEPAEPLKPWEVIVTLILAAPFILLGILVLREPK